jgi:hypothetical protein
MEGVKVQLLIPRAGNAERCISSGTSRLAFPLAEPLTGVPRALGEESRVLQYSLPGPQELKDLHSHFRHVAKVPVDSLHMGDPGMQRNEMFIWAPRGIRTAGTMFSPKLHHLLVRVWLGVREKL